MPSKFIVPIQFKTLLAPASVLMVALPFDTPKLPLQITQTNAAVVTTQVGAAASVNIVNQPTGPLQPSAFQVITTKAGGGLGTYSGIKIYVPVTLTKEPQLPPTVTFVSASVPAPAAPVPGKVTIYSS